MHFNPFKFFTETVQNKIGENEINAVDFMFLWGFLLVFVCFVLF